MVGSAELQRLKSMGYSFEIKEKPLIAQTSRRDAVTFFNITVGYKLEIIGVSSGLSQEQAISQAVRLAQKHEAAVPQ